MQEATVKTFFAGRHYGFLINPKGGKDIFFRSNDRIDRGPQPTSGKKVQILNLGTTSDGLRATKWRLLEG